MKNLSQKTKIFFESIKIPGFFKTKKFLALIFLFVLLFLFTPISLHQIGKKVEGFINDKAETGVQTFEKQTGLKIEWKQLSFNIFTMTAKLEGAQVIPLNSSKFQKIQELRFLDGLQKIGKISARPSLYSLLSKKQIILSKLKIQDGDIHLKTLKHFLRKPKGPRNIALPIKKIEVKNTSLSVRHGDHRMKLSDIQSSVAQKKEGVFHFDLFVQSFLIRRELGFQGFQSLRNLLPKENGLKAQSENQVYQLSFRGTAQKGKVSFQDINLRNSGFQSLTKWLDIHFNSRGVHTINVKSSGSLPSSLIQKGMDLAGKNALSFEALLSYKINIQYREKKGYQGFFELEGREAVFKSNRLKHFSFKGKLSSSLLTMDEGRVETENHGSLTVKKGNLSFKEGLLKFDFSAEANRLSSDFVTQTILDLRAFPAAGDLTGSIQCEGGRKGEYLKCLYEGQSQRLKIQPENQNEIMSFYDMKMNTEWNWDGQILNFTVNGQKNDLPSLEFKGRYSEPLDRLSASYSFIGKLKEDLQFNTPFPLTGQIQIQKGKVTVDKDQAALEGELRSPLLKIQSYKLQNISSSYKLENKKLDFFNIKGFPGRTNYTAKCSVDFENDQLAVKMTASFFDIENFVEAAEDRFSLPVQLKGTGTASFSMIFPWSAPDSRQFQLKADLFNVLIDQDSFQQVTLDFGIQNQKGLVRSLLFKKGQGFIQGGGVFDNSYSMDLDVTGQNLSLERLEKLNKILPFNQSGDIDFSMKITGAPWNPLIQGDVQISDMFVYSYPVRDSRLKLSIDKKALSFSGRIMEGIHIDKFIYPISGKSKASASGKFNDLDFIKIFASKNKVEKAQDYFSRTTGYFSFSKIKDAQKTWEGVLQFRKFLISKTDKWIRNEKPFTVSFNQNRWSLSSVQFFHQNNEKLVIEKRNNNKLFLSGESFLGPFSIFFPFLKELEGNIKGQLLTDNNLKKLHPRGSLEIKKGRLFIKPLPEFTGIKASLIFSKNNVFINDFLSEAGGGQTAGGGSIFYNFADLPALNLNLIFSNAHINIPKDFNTKGSGEIQIKGGSQPYLISGQYIIDSGSITKDFSGGSKKTKYDFSFLNREAKKQDSVFELNLNIKTRQAIAVRSSLIRSFVEGEADIYGPLSSLLVNGGFALFQKAEENLIFFRGQEFKINSGSITFKKSEPDNPHLNIKAETLFTKQIIDPLESQREIERQYKILLSLTGSSHEPVFTLKSAPSLNEKEIISLLTLGVGSRHFDANVKQNVTDYSYQILASMLLEKPLNREIKDTLGVDFRLTPYINTLNKPVTKITLSRSWFKKWRTSFSRTIEDAESDVRLRYALNPKASLTAFWENTRQIELENNLDDRMGFDFEFNFDF